ncbi:kunitz-type protease inhibitor 2-like [Corythoichthys intestinalis]|uniref:kunitz-type protease inhibitor 2-like n=1 Tax=Corythoichthys intestinalis TaxID=161448 RepID=UPI0025A5A9FB|nr:kunitz-type protease inhibitor 2-like [Corythoichthys intestinalis]XP_057695928.1 kunitz-type protease inhibitor 2-like [Corythoichthys intestinalis]
MTRSTLRCALFLLYVSYVVSDSQASQNGSSNANDTCSLPKEVGPCRASFPRFYYNSSNQACLEFVYGGCQGNGNNFVSLAKCESTCGQVSGSATPTPSPALAESFEMQQHSQPRKSNYGDIIEDKVVSAQEYAERCEAAPMVGPCKAAFRSWYYDSDERRCKMFIYGGCRGNKNNYNSQESCLQACHVRVVPAPRKLRPSDSSSVTEEECMSSPDPGPCRAAFPKFYYHAESDSCKPFIYGGCHGNSNRYESAEDCLARCSGFADGFFAGRDKSRSRWTAGFFVLLTLAAVCTVLVSALVVTMLRRVHLTRRASIVSDKEELLPDVHSSLESLSVKNLPTMGKA